MHLIWATEEFVLKTRPYPGFPILLHEDMRSTEAANAFMRYYLTRGRIGSKQSWPPTGRAMYDYFSFLEANGLDWKDVHRGDELTLVGAYRDYCLDTVKLDRNTVRQRLLYICEFYEYALRQKWVDALPFGHEERFVPRDNGFLAHVDASGGSVTVRDVSPKAKKNLPKFLSKSEVQALLAAAKNPHHRMIVRLGLQTGLRREEIATFPLAYVFDPDAAGRTERNIRIRLNPQDGHGMRTKGSKPRDIYVGRALLKDLHFYATHKRGERAQLSEIKHKPLFLNQGGVPFAANGKRIGRIVSNIGAAVGIKAWPHMLRHTYATHTLNAMRRGKSDIEPLVFLQRQLGHESINTTMIYLHLVNERADEAVLAYDDELNDWMQES
jgi:integrase/recombinase XerD